jgi:periplasmic protein TonB
MHLAATTHLCYGCSKLIRREFDLKPATAPLDTAFDIPRLALPRLVIVIAIHALLLFAFVAGDRVLRTVAPQVVTLLATIPPEVVKPPPPPPPPSRRTSKTKAPAREAAAPPLRDIEVAPRTDVVATIADNAIPVEVAGGKPGGTGTAGAGDRGAGAGGAGGGKAPVIVQALTDPDNCERPRLPESAERRRLSGHVILAVKIEADGRVTEARVAKSSGLPVLDQVAVESARNCHFVAATIDKVPVSSWMPFRFSWSNR